MKTALTFVTLSLVLFTAWCSAKPELPSDGIHYMDVLSGSVESADFEEEGKDGEGKDDKLSDSYDSARYKWREQRFHDKCDGEMDDEENDYSWYYEKDLSKYTPNPKMKTPLLIFILSVFLLVAWTNAEHNTEASDDEDEEGHVKYDEDDYYDVLISDDKDTEKEDMEEEEDDEEEEEDIEEVKEDELDEEWYARYAPKEIKDE
uniref:Expressed conserved protein n=1 Tax=Echinococcus granulosus TaxID=6210 RepID=A0A068WQE5_ECHGR|nr:hypothetical protein EgrG_001142400 [Echinococcus granulosus]